jgi:hypothetical protein
MPFLVLALSVLSKESLLFAVIRFSASLGKLAHKLALFRVESLGSFNNYGKDEVASAVGIFKSACAASAKAEGCSRLGSLRDRELLRSLKCGNVDLGTESCLSNRYRDVAIDIVSSAIEELMGLYSYLNNKISCGTSVRAVITHSAYSDASAVINSRGDGDSDLFLLFGHAVSAALRTGFLDDLTGSAASLACDGALE